MSTSGARDAAWWIDHLSLKSHPEGGSFRETYRADETYGGDALPSRYGGAARAVATSIYYLLERGQRSRLHRLASDELWYFHAGDPITLHLLDHAGGYRTRPLGLDVEAGEVPQLAIVRGTWFGATLEHGAQAGAAGYSLVGCVVAPGFDFADFELADEAEILDQFPEHRMSLAKLL